MLAINIIEEPTIKGILVLISISLMNNDVEPLLMCFLAIFIPSLDKCLFKSFIHALIQLFNF